MNKDEKNVRVDSIVFDAKTVTVIVVFCASIAGTYWDSQRRVNDLALLQVKAETEARLERVEMARQVGALARSTNILIALQTLRPDPWSGDMSADLVSELYAGLRPHIPNLDWANMPDVEAIQARNVEKIVPSALSDKLDAFSKDY